MTDKVLNDTVFPKGATKDIATQRRLIAEKWNRFFPEITYYSLKLATTPVTPADKPTGEATASSFDPIYGEVLPSTMRTQWEQPHLSGTHEATARGEYMPAVLMHGRMQREALDLDLKKWGFDRVRDLIVTVPRSFSLDALVDPLKPGDYFVWDGDEYDVAQIDKDGWWKNVNVRLFWVLNCEHRRKGS
jgi:hypothetical protein